MLKVIAAWIFALLVLIGGAVSAVAAPVMHEPGWTIAPFVTLPSTRAEDPEVDGAGNLYVACGQDGVFRVTPTGSVSLWSAAQGYGIAMLPSGQAYLPSRDIFTTKYLWDIQSDGSYSALVTGASPSWLYCAASPSGLLYANVIGTGKGIYMVDRQTGSSTPVLIGGPGPGGVGTYSDMATTSDNTLYVSGALAPGIGIFRILGGVSAQVIPLPIEMIGLCRGPSDTLFGATYQGSGPTTDGQAWRLNVDAGAGTVFASGFGVSDGIAYAPTLDRFYVIDLGGQVWKITHDSTPAMNTTWGGVKSKYR